MPEIKKPIFFLRNPVPKAAVACLFLSLALSPAACKGNSVKVDSSKATSEIPNTGPTIAQEPPAAVPGSLTDEERATLTAYTDFASPDYVKAFIARPHAPEWFGLYAAGQKVGYAKMEMRRTRAAEPGGFAVNVATFLPIDGKDVITSETTFYEDTPPRRSLAVFAAQAIGEDRVEQHFLREGHRTRVKTLLHGEAAGPDSWAPEMCGNLDTDVALSMPDLATIKQDSVARVCRFSTTDKKQIVREIRVKSLEMRRIAGVDTRVVTLLERDNLTAHGLEITTTESGHTLEVSIAPEVQLKQEDEAVAKSDIVGLDVASAAVN